MGKIKVLDERTRLKIAAGEVVQNPASVVKELLENAIDAQATKIIINIQKGGKHLIELIDNGVGMSAEDAEIAFQRYSTSKITDISDLERIYTLGFRGEALASIAAISQVELVTKEPETTIGTRIVIKGSKLIKKEEAERANGTTVRVQNLFFNVPARLKFLKTSSLEFQVILNIVTNYALFYETIHFILTHNGMEVLNSPPGASQLDKIFFVYGKDIAKNMMPITFNTEIFKISGLISKPIIQRGTRKFYSIFVNNRLIKSQLVIDAIDAAYKTLLPKNRHPLVVLGLTVDPALVDINVHPTKQEVKFSQESLISDTLQKVILDTFNKEKIIPEIKIKQRPKSVPREQELPSIKATTVQQKLLPHSEITSVVENESIITPKTVPTAKLPYVEIIGQAHALFIIAADDENLYIIDQHAAHERIMFEKFLKKLEDGSLPVQTVLSPIIIEFPLHEVAKLEANLALLAKYGFEIEPFGKGTYRITKLPIVLGKTVKREEIQLVIDELLQKIDPESKQIPSSVEIAQLYGCKAAIKAGDKLSISQMEKLYRELQHTENPYVCAHNRPTIITFSKEELERKFHR
ncbi:MAG: DNA mismatch repair endonuclease MutL [Candidatus Helarchaeota archaeon]